jgi:hypothetical protein
MTDKTIEFQKGDIVDWLGMKGVVAEVLLYPEVIYPVKVSFTWPADFGYHRTTKGFTGDGRYILKQEKSLILTERPKKKRKFYEWIDKNGSFQPSLITKDFKKKNGKKSKYAQENIGQFVREFELVCNW